ncbi:hypothetical protein H6F77_03940 [Microcoleus sp. FACHB-831]|uniref:hypothetical protein n=1 Tax=Microcoleus sp. FACHB-831 TaxID=2692827 RepID=UPI00168581F9|nr:hypothetical protein [Microcoleus sp. FACHB-831]MBD1920267.1 hypothetical protein [Microcoleus sp. FACHB-831]
MSKSILDLLRDPIWTVIVGIVGIIVSVLISLYIYRRQKPKKEITCRVVSLVPLFNVTDNFQGKLQVFYESKPIQNVFIMTVRVYNSGNTSIQSSDYDKPLSLNIGTDHVLSAEVIETNPDNITASVTFNSSSIQISPVLLNPNDALLIKAVIEQYHQKFSASARIVGMRQLQVLLPEQFEKGLLRQEEKLSMMAMTLGVAAIIVNIIFLLRAVLKL